MLSNWHSLLKPLLVLVLWEMLHAVSSQTLALSAGSCAHTIYRESQNEKHQQI